MNLDKIVKWMNKTEGRDKFCKMIQYICRLLASYFKKKAQQVSYDSDYYSLQCTNLYQSFKDGRKLFRIFKSIQQYQQMMKIILDEALNFPDNDKDQDISRQKAIQIVFRILQKICFFFYWFFDNISILSKIKLFKKDYQKYNQLGSVFWFLALTFSLGNSLSVLMKDDEKIFRMRKIQSMQNMKTQKTWLSLQQGSQANEQSMNMIKSYKQYSKQKKLEKKQALINCLRCVCDLLPAGKDSNIISFIFKRQIPQQAVGIGGFLSALIASYQVYNS